MATLSLRISDNEKRLIKTRAAYEGKTITQFILEATGVKKKGTIHEAMKDLEEGRYQDFNSFEEWQKDMEKAFAES